MTTPTLADLLGENYALGEFTPGAHYQPAMDWLLFLAEDVAYRAQPLIIGVVDILWHAQDERIVGVKIWDVSKHPAGLAILKTAGLFPD